MMTFLVHSLLRFFPPEKWFNYLVKLLACTLLLLLSSSSFLLWMLQRLELFSQISAFSLVKTRNIGLHVPPDLTHLRPAYDLFISFPAPDIMPVTLRQITICSWPDHSLQISKIPMLGAESALLMRYTDVLFLCFSSVWGCQLSP